MWCVQGWEDAVANWREIPIGGIHRGPDAVKKIWYNHAIVPLWAAIGLASVVCGGYLIKYFGGHTEITWSKSLRATYDHQARMQPRRRPPPACRPLNAVVLTVALAAAHRA